MSVLTLHYYRQQNATNDTVLHCALQVSLSSSPHAEDRFLNHQDSFLLLISSLHIYHTDDIPTALFAFLNCIHYYRRLFLCI